MKGKDGAIYTAGRPMIGQKHCRVVVDFHNFRCKVKETWYWSAL